MLKISGWVSNLGGTKLPNIEIMFFLKKKNRDYGKHTGRERPKAPYFAGKPRTTY